MLANWTIRGASLMSGAERRWRTERVGVFSKDYKIQVFSSI